MKLRRTADGLIVSDGAGGWVSLPAAAGLAGAHSDALSPETTTNLAAFLAGGERTRSAAAALLEQVHGQTEAAGDPAAAQLPFQPRSMRAFMLWESHLVAASRVLVKRFFPAPVSRATTAFEAVTGRTFPMLKPKKRFYEIPAFYVANHTALLADGDDMWWPSHTSFLDFELELAFVLARPLIDATPEEGRAAIGGFFVLNDWSARDVQAADARENIFGPVVKSKTFANSIGYDVITADELPDWQRATGRVRVDGETWCEGTTAEAAHDLGEMLAYASAGERLEAGDVISTGCMPTCCGLELDRWIKPGNVVELEIDAIGTLTNKVREDGTPETAFGA